MKRTGPPQRKTRLRRVGRKAESEAPALAAFRTAVHARIWCELGTPVCPQGRHEGHHAHHIVRRSQGGGHDPSNGLLACSDGHSYVHAHPAESFDNGWLGRAS